MSKVKNYARAIQFTESKNPWIPETPTEIQWAIADFMNEHELLDSKEFSSKDGGYLIISPTGSWYVGTSSSSAYWRCMSHFGGSHNKHLNNSIKFHGVENFMILPVRNFQEMDHSETEIYAIELLTERFPGKRVNIGDGGEGLALKRMKEFFPEQWKEMMEKKTRKIVKTRNSNEELRREECGKLGIEYIRVGKRRYKKISENEENQRIKSEKLGLEYKSLSTRSGETFRRNEELRKLEALENGTEYVSIRKKTAERLRELEKSKYEDSKIKGIEYKSSSKKGAESRIKRERFEEKLAKELGIEYKSSWDKASETKKIIELKKKTESEIQGIEYVSFGKRIYERIKQNEEIRKMKGEEFLSFKQKISLGILEKQELKRKQCVLNGTEFISRNEKTARTKKLNQYLDKVLLRQESVRFIFEEESQFDISKFIPYV